MPPTLPEPTRRAKTQRALSLLALALLAAALTTLLVWRLGTRTPLATPAGAPVATSCTNLVLVAGRLCLSGATNAFTGVMLEQSADGSLRSRSAVSNGLLEGLSEGWHTNGQLQVTEHFRAGVSHGLRTKWHPNGIKLSEGEIVDGQFHGTFRRWYESGALAEQVEMVHGQPDGLALAYFESGCLKTRARLQAGKVLNQTTWNDGEQQEAPAQVLTSTASVESP